MFANSFVLGLATLVAALTNSAVATSSSSSVDSCTLGDAKLYGINYDNRAGADWEPTSTRCKTQERINQDLAQLKTITDRLRLYSLIDCTQNETVVPQAIELGFTLDIGLWVPDMSTDTTTFASEKESLSLLLEAGTIDASNVEGIQVGSEAIYRGDVTVAQAITNLQEVREILDSYSVDIPLTIADISDTYMSYSDLLDAVDYASINEFPFWEMADIDTAMTNFHNKYDVVETAAAALNKSVVIGETGWPTGGVDADASTASPENAAQYLQEFYDEATSNGWAYFYFSSYDEPYKVTDENATVEGYFGIYNQSGTMKTEFSTLALAAGSDCSSSSSASSDSSIGGSLLGDTTSDYITAGSSSSSVSSGEVSAASASSSGSAASEIYSTTAAAETTSSSSAASEISTTTAAAETTSSTTSTTSATAYGSDSADDSDDHDAC